MTVYSGPVFDMAARQFGTIADHLAIPFNERDRLLALHAGDDSIRRATYRRDGAGHEHQQYHILDRAFDQMVRRAERGNIPQRTAAMAVGVEKVRAAKATRGLFP